jgi:hypothetical protein
VRRALCFPPSDSKAISAGDEWHLFLPKKDLTAAVPQRPRCTEELSRTERCAHRAQQTVGFCVCGCFEQAAASAFCCGAMGGVGSPSHPSSLTALRFGCGCGESYHLHLAAPLSVEVLFTAAVPQLLSALIRSGIPNRSLRYRLGAPQFT